MQVTVTKEALAGVACELAVLGVTPAACAAAALRPRAGKGRASAGQAKVGAGRRRAAADHRADTTGAKRGRAAAADAAVTAAAATLAALDRALAGALADAIAAERFAGQRGQTVIVTAPAGAGPARRVALCGLGEVTEADNAADPAAGQLALAGQAVRLGNRVGATTVALAAPAGATPAALALLARGGHLGGYRFDAYRTAPPPPATVRRLILAGVPTGVAARPALAAGTAVAQATAVARDLVNMPPQDLYPETFARRAAALARGAGLRCRIMAPPELRRQRMNLLLAVGQGSVRSPRLVHLAYVPARGQAAGSVALIGKGITFDSGGLDLKTADGMLTMKVDMAGAAAVLGAVLAAAARRLPVAVHGILALAENMPSGSALRPSDVIASAAGRTVEVNNTDAEGRLVLADALHYAGKLKPSCMIDVATLTGACMVALGPHTSGLCANDDALAGDLLAAAARQGEGLWRMPLDRRLRPQLDSDIADLRNTGERYGGMITAALFLREFVGKTPWAHLDIAGPALSHAEGGATSRGGTGVAVATLSDFLAVRAGARG